MMKMTKQRPTEPAWYWYKLPGSWSLQPALVFDGGAYFGLMYSLNAIDDRDDYHTRDGLEMRDASDDALWSSDAIEPPNA